MKVNVYSKEIKISEDLAERISKQLSVLNKYLMIEEDTIAQVIAKKHGNDVKLEITIPSKIGYLRGEAVEKQLTDASEKAVDKIEKQIRKEKTRLSRRHKEKLSKTFVSEVVEVQKEDIVKKIKRIVADEMDQEEAIIQMELLGHDFFVYKDATSKVNCVIYARKDGGYGILEIV